MDIIKEKFFNRLLNNNGTEYSLSFLTTEEINFFLIYISYICRTKLSIKEIRNNSNKIFIYLSTLLFFF